MAQSSLPKRFSSAWSRTACKAGAVSKPFLRPQISQYHAIGELPIPHGLGTPGAARPDKSTRQSHLILRTNPSFRWASWVSQPFRLKNYEMWAMQKADQDIGARHKRTFANHSSRLLVVSPDSMGTACPLSPETPLIVLCRFPGPALSNQRKKTASVSPRPLNS